MANVDNPHGFRPLMRSIIGAPAAAVKAHKLVGDGVAMFINDAVCAVASGTKGYPAIATGAAITPGTTPIFGVNLTQGAASTATDHLVIPAMYQVFECQDDADTDGVEAASINKNANLVTNAGSATTGISGHELDEATINTTNSLDLAILKLFDAPDNAFGNHARVEVMFNVPFGLSRTGV